MLLDQEFSKYMNRKGTILTVLVMENFSYIKVFGGVYFMGAV